MDIINEIDKEEIGETKIPKFNVGDTICIHTKLKEGGKERTQRFQGTVISERGSGSRKTITVRKVSQGYGIERILPLYSPTITKIEIVRHGKVRRAKLYYLRERKGKSARVREK